MKSNPDTRPCSEKIDEIPVIWFEPEQRTAKTRLALWLPPLSTTKETTINNLRELAAAGFHALSFDPFQHGERTTESQSDLLARVFGDFRRHMWPILGQTTLDTLRIIDWALKRFELKPEVYLGGHSMGGDVSVAVAGLDTRVKRVAALVTTPDWLRPGMHMLDDPGRLLPQGEPDGYAQFFYDQFDPITHLENYAHGPAIAFECGGNDSHVPAEGAQRFQAAFRQKYPSLAERVRVNVIPNAAHMDSRKPPFWENALRWLVPSGTADGS